MEHRIHSQIDNETPVRPQSQMNYSPKHGQGPSLLLSHRNLNVKHLSLGLRPPTPKLAIPTLITPSVTETPINPPPAPEQTNRKLRPLLPLPSLLQLPLPSQSIPSDIQQQPSDVEAPPPSAVLPSELPQLPPEFHEQNALSAYPDGPANVYNGRLFLYSDPHALDVQIDINDYDLVVNVARECPNLLPWFDSRSGKKYVHVPWSHTLSIQHELPNLVDLISKHDQPGKKILVHCHCGVLRSACVVVAFFMVRFGLSVNDAYELLKAGTDSKSPPSQKIAAEGHHVDPCEQICPNMGLIFELMDFGHSHVNEAGHAREEHV